MHQRAWPYRSARLANQGIVPEASHCGGLAAEPYVSPKCLRQCQSVELKIRQDSPYSNQDQSNPTATPRMSSCNVWFIVLFTRHLAGPQAVFLSNCQHKLQHSIIPINQYMVHRSVFPPSRRPSGCLPIQLPTQAAAQYHSHQPIYGSPFCLPAISQALKLSSYPIANTSCSTVSFQSNLSLPRTVSCPSLKLKRLQSSDTSEHLKDVCQMIMCSMQLLGASEHWSSKPRVAARCVLSPSRCPAASQRS